MKLASLLAITLTLPAMAQNSAYEVEAVLPASAFLAPELLQGPSHRVRQQVVTDGYLAHFEIDTDFGTFEAVGVPEAKRRIVEASALRRLVETSKSDLFAEGMKRSIEQPIDAVKNIVKNPVESVKQAPKTIGHFFTKIGTTVSRQVQNIEEKVKSDNEPSAGEIGRGVGQGAKNLAGFQKAKLDTAKQLGVDPYSDNPRLQEEMEKVTWAFFAGGLPLRIGAMAASAGLAVTATNMVGIPEDTYALTESELTLRDQRSLEAMGIGDTDIRHFLTNPIPGVSTRHRIIVCLEGLPHVRGKEDVVRLAAACETRGQASILAQSLAILAERQKAGSDDYVSIRVLGRLFGATTAKGQFHVPAPVDFVSWTQEVATFANRDDLGADPKFLIHTGRLSAATAAGLTARNWNAVAVPYPSL